MMRALFFLGVTLLASCGNKQDAPPAPATAAPPPAPAVPPPVAAKPAADPCDAGDAAACVAAARKIAPQGAYRVQLSKEEADAKEAATTKLAKRACELGNGEGCALVARYGHGIDDDMLQRSCKLGYVPSCGSIGRQLADAGSTRKDRERAAELLEQACTADVVDWMALTSHHGGFCQQLYDLYSGPLQDKVKAGKALERACAQGDKTHCACKTTADCGKVPEDEAGDFDCQDGRCEIAGGD